MILPRYALAVLAWIFMTLAHTVFAADSRSDQQFSGERAFEILKNQCAFGPRVPGSGAHDAAMKYMMNAFTALGLQPRTQDFQAAPTLMNHKPVSMHNILARQGNASRTLILSAHWDCRPVADQESDDSMRATPIMGANDGASGVAVVLELARVFSQQPIKASILYALWDGEDLGSKDAPTQWCLGSKYFASTLDSSQNVKLVINIDMVGDNSLSFTRERYSMAACPEFESFCWKAGQGIAPQAFTDSDRRSVMDDHIPFLRIGIPSFDLIDLNYPPWHTTADTVDKCSPASLQIAGRSVEAMVRALDKTSWNFTAGTLPQNAGGM